MKQLLTKWNSNNGYINANSRQQEQSYEKDELFINYEDFLSTIGSSSKTKESLKTKTDQKWQLKNVTKKKLLNTKSFTTKSMTESIRNFKAMKKSIQIESQFSSKSPLRAHQMIQPLSKTPLSRKGSNLNTKVPSTPAHRRILQLNTLNLPKISRLEKMSIIKQNDEQSARRRNQLLTEDDQNQQQDPQYNGSNPILESTKNNDPFSYFYKQDQDDVKFKLQLYHEEQPLIGALVDQYQQNQNVLPKKLNIYSNTQQNIQLKNYFIGKNHQSILGTLLNNKEFKSVDLSNTNISSSFLKNLKIAPQQLNLSKNKVDIKSCQLLGQLFLNRKQYLKEINLESNKIGNKAAIELVRHLNDNRSLKLLNLSDNQLDDQFAIFFKNILISNDTIEELYLHWNQIRSVGAASILEGCTTRDYVKVLDLSWNQVGTRKGVGQAHDRLCKCLMRSKKSIVHFDLSFNGFNQRESELLQISLKNNKSLLGFHFEGNYGYVDRQGFLQLPSDFEIYKLVTLKPTHRIQGAKPAQTQTQQSNSKYRDHCWICDNWQEVSFSWPMLEPFDQILVHLSHENFKPIELEMNKEQDYEVIRMCPLGRVWFYFTINKEQRISNIYNVEQNGEILMNFIDVQMTKQIVDEDFDLMMEIEPRKVDKMFEYASDENLTDNPIEEEEQEEDLDEDTGSNNLNYIKPRQKWKISKSIFKDYIRDTDELLDKQSKTFEFDWNNSKINSIKGIDVESMKVTLRKYFRIFKDLFRYVASQSISSNVPVVTLNQFHDLTSFLKFKSAPQVDIKYLEVRQDFQQQSQSTQTLIQINSTSSFIQQQNPVIYSQIQNTKGLNRRQFLELIVRVIGGASQFELLAEQNLLPSFKGYESDSWRFRRYWNSYCERVIRKHQHIFEHLYVKYCSSKIKPFSAYKCLYFEEFKQIWIDSGFVGRITDREIGLCFFLSLQTQVEEINSDRYLCLNFMEFLESLGRMAERLSLPPILQKKDVSRYLIKYNRQTSSLCHYVLNQNL